MTMKYKQPTVGDNKVVYKGKRYWIIELSGKDEIEGFGSDFCQYLMYDKLYEGILATIVRDDKGTLTASLMSHVELSYDFQDMKELIRSVPLHADAYYKACGG